MGSVAWFSVTDVSVRPKATTKECALAFTNGMLRNDMTFDEYGVACDNDKNTNKCEEAWI